MRTPSIEKDFVVRIAELHFQGLTPENISERAHLDEAEIRECLRRLESVLLLVAHEFPVPLVPRVTSLGQEEVGAYVDAIHRHLGGKDEVREHVRKAIPTCAGETAAPAKPRSDTDQCNVDALEVLDFWASRWLR